MAFKVNYGLQRAERNRAKEAKKEERARSKQAAKTAEANGEAPESEADAGTATATDSVAPETT